MAGGQVINSGQGSVTQSLTLALVGIAIAVSAGAIIADAGAGVAISGSASTSAAGTSAPSTFIGLRSRKVGGGAATNAISGVSSAVGAGIFAPAIARSLSGASIAASAGALITSRNRLLTGAQSTSSTGSMTAPSAGGLLYPAGMNDPIFTGMTERTGTLDLVAGTTYTKLSWLDDNTDTWTCLMANNTTCNTWRMRTREGPRYRGAINTAFNWLYLELYGIAGDHADGSQWEGGTNAVVYKNCHFRGLDGAHTLQWCADGARGSYVFEDCLFTNDGGSCQSALKLFADAGFGTVTLSMKNCYVQQTGWSVDQFQINNTSGTSAVDVILWDNVRNCSWNHTTGVLTPGSLIAQPSGT